MRGILSKFTTNPNGNHIFKFKTKYLWEIKEINTLVKMLNVKLLFHFNHIEEIDLVFSFLTLSINLHIGKLYKSDTMFPLEGTNVGKYCWLKSHSMFSIRYVFYKVKSFWYQPVVYVLREKY